MTLQAKRLFGSLGALLYAAGAVLGGQELVYHTGGRDAPSHYVAGSIVGAALGALALLLAVLVGFGVRTWWSWVGRGW